MTTATAKLTATDIMTTDVITVSTQDTVIEAADKILQAGVSNAPVIEHDMTRDILVGFVSEKDLMQCYADGVFYDQPGLKIEKIMHSHPVSVREDADIYTLAAIFMQYGFRHVPVVKANLLQGIVSRRDVLRALKAEFGEWQQAGSNAGDAPNLKAIFAPKYVVS